MAIINHTPLYVWGVFAYLLFIGLKSTQTRQVPLLLLLLIPMIFTCWSIFVLISHYGLSPLPPWLCSFTIGGSIGYLTARSLPIRFENRQVEIPGSWIPLFLSLSLFLLRYILGVFYVLYPEWIVNRSLLPLELVCTFIAGLFAGRVASLWIRYLKAQPP